MNMILAEIHNYVGEVDFAIWFVVAVSVFMLGLITFLMIYFVIKYRRDKNPIPTNIPHNTLLEVIWIVVPTIVVLYMFWVGYVGFDTMRSKVPENAMKVKVTARMWSFLYEYENGKKSNELYVPQGTPVKLDLTSQDVVHAFYIPVYKIKEDCIPLRHTYLWFLPDKLGTFKVYCAEYCGTGHSAMLSKVHVISPEDFQKWMKGEKIQLAAAKDQKESGSSSTSKGLDLLKTNGCVSCHSLDGSPSVGPTLSKIWGTKKTVTENNQEKEVTVDEEYIKNSVLKPNLQIVKGFQPIMPPSEGILSEDDIHEIIEYFKSDVAK